MSYKFLNKYGWDKLSKVLIIIGLLLLSSRMFILAAAIIVYGLWRTQSSNFAARQRELMSYYNLERKINLEMKRIMNKFLKIVNELKNRIEYKKKNRGHVIISCPRCNQKLRLPKNKGGLIVTCARCKNKFKVKT